MSAIVHLLQVLDVTNIEDTKVYYVGVCPCGWSSKVNTSLKKIEGWHSAHVKGNPKVYVNGRWMS